MKIKHLNKLIAICAVIVAFPSCKKDLNVPLTPLASVNVTNAVVGGATLTYNTTTLTVANNSYKQLSVIPGQSMLNLYPAATPSNPYYRQTLPTNSGDNYSLFLAGSSPTAIDAILIKENYQNYADSLCGVRFINLSPNSNPISVNITGNANGSEVASLVYKAYSSFLQHPAKATNVSYSFQVKDAGTGTLIGSITLTTPRFHNTTIVVRGLVGGSPAAGLTAVNNF